MSSGNVVFGREAPRGMFGRQSAMNTSAGSMRRFDGVASAGGVRRLPALAVAIASMFLASPSMAISQQSAVAGGEAPPEAIAASAASVDAPSTGGVATSPLLVGVPISLDESTGRLQIDRDQLRASLAAMTEGRAEVSPIVALVPRGEYGQFRGGRLGTGARERLLAVWGEPAAGTNDAVSFVYRYADALVAALGSAIDEVRTTVPDARVTVVNLPLEGRRMTTVLVL